VSLGGGEGELELDGGELAESALPAAAVVAVLDPERHLVGQLVAGPPTALVEDVALQERENDSIAALSPAEATRPIDPVSPAVLSTARKARGAELLQELIRRELYPAALAIEAAGMTFGLYCWPITTEPRPSSAGVQRQPLWCRMPTRGRMQRVRAEVGTVVVTRPLDGRDLPEVRIEGARSYTVWADGRRTVEVPGTAPQPPIPADEWADVDFMADSWNVP
jgi:hypothetical protein